MKYPEYSNWVNQHPDRLQRFDAARLIPRDLKCGLKALLVTLALMGGRVSLGMPALNACCGPREGHVDRGLQRYVLSLVHHVVTHHIWAEVCCHL